MLSRSPQRAQRAQRAAHLMILCFIMAQPAHIWLVAARCHQHAAAAVVAAPQRAAVPAVVPRDCGRCACCLLRCLLCGGKGGRAGRWGPRLSCLLRLLRLLCCGHGGCNEAATARLGLTLRRACQGQPIPHASCRQRGGRGCTAAAAAVHAALLRHNVVTRHDVLPKVRLALQSREERPTEATVSRVSHRAAVCEAWLNCQRNAARGALVPFPPKHHTRP